MSYAASIPSAPSRPAASVLPGPLAATLSFKPPAELTDEERDEAWNLACTSVNTTRAWFYAQLARYDEVLLYRDRVSGRLVGTTGLHVLDRTVGGRPARILYTGTVTVDPAWRGRGLIPYAGFRTLLRRGAFGRRAMYWLMDTDSWRAYALAVGALPHAWPRPDDRGDAEVYDRVCADVFGEDWDPARRVCRPIAERRLHPDLARIPPEVLAKNPHARAYAALNPGHEQGDALPVLTRLGLANVWTSLVRALGQPFRATRGRAPAV